MKSPFSLIGKLATWAWGGPYESANYSPRRGRGADHQRWPNRYFTGLGLFNLKEAQVLELISLRQEATH